VDAVATLISIHKDQTAVVNGLWTIYQGISLALLGYVFSQEVVRRNAWVLGFLTVIFVFFSVANQRAMLRSQQLIVASASELKVLAAAESTDKHLQSVLGVYDALPICTLKFAHYSFTAIVVASIWVMFVAFRFQKEKQAA
jgi:hypothetical protein